MLNTLKRGYQRTPEDVEGALRLAAAFRETGQLQQASRTLLRLLDHQPGHPEALFWLSHQMSLEPDSPALLQLERCWEQGGPGTADERSYVLFALARVREQQGRWTEAFGLYQQANQARQQALGLLNTDAVLYVEQADLMQHLDRQLEGLADLAASADSGRDLVFLVGLPRCGSTLVETMLGQAEGALARGELRALPKAVRETNLLQTLRQEPLLPEPVAAGLASVGAAYRLDLGSEQAAISLDKTLTNFLYLGLIVRIWPQARIVHVERHPLDQILSAWCTRFREGHHYSLALTDLVRVQIAYRRLMEHWHAVLPAERLYRCRYEQLVQAPEPESEALARFCGLRWCESMLQPQRSTRRVLTASFQQVRQPIHDRSIGRWRHYAAELEPYAAQLREAGVVV